MHGSHGFTCRFTAANASSARRVTSSAGRFKRPRPNATSAPAVGITTWWSGFWNTNARGASTRSRPAWGRSMPAHTRKSVDYTQDGRGRAKSVPETEWRSSLGGHTRLPAAVGPQKHMKCASRHSQRGAFQRLHLLTALSEAKRHADVFCQNRVSLLI